MTTPRDITQLEPSAVWKHFARLCEIPRISKHELEASAYVAEAGRQMGLEVIIDPAGNVLIGREASRGKEHLPRIILQSHVDMVGQKSPESDHDFARDPIRPVIDGEWVKASGTTLGADNGIGAALTLGLLEDRTLESGPIDGLFTVDEETGMSGAFALEPEMIRADYLINLDAEQEGELFIGCAGGIDALVDLPVTFGPLPDRWVAYTVAIGGLRGGHSGIDIHLGRANALKLLNRVLAALTKKVPLLVAGVEGGSARNAIPREAEAIVALPPDSTETFTQTILALRRDISNELAGADPGVTLTVSPCTPPASVLDRASQERLLRALYACPNGVVRMSDEAPGTVETSNNIAVVRFRDGAVRIECMLRSARDSALDDLRSAVESVFTLAGGRVSFGGAYPPWQPNPSSKLLASMRATYRGMTGTDPAVKLVHAGLETGIIGSKRRGIDMIACGPTIRHPHSPDERVHIGSVERFWQFLRATVSGGA